MKRISFLFTVVLVFLLAEKPLHAQNHAYLQESDTVIKVQNVEFGMVFVRGGEFVQGAAKSVGKVSKTGANPSHKVVVGNYFIGQTEVTQGLWKAVMGEEVTLWGGWRSHGYGDDYPVYHVRWTDVQTFIARLNALTGMQFRLPTEAEWEYAARGGATGGHTRYAGGLRLADWAWYQKNGEGRTHPVAQKRPNALGLYDMSGNVWEWCGDWYANYPVETQVNPQGPASGEEKVVRGGGWGSVARHCSVMHRDANVPSHMFDGLGFRLALSAPQQPLVGVRSPHFKELTFRSGQYHVQGLAFDPRSQCVFLSTTTAIVKMSLDGSVLGSVVGFHGHIGAVTLDTLHRRLYASLEDLDDALCTNMARYANRQPVSREQIVMSIVEVDIDKVNAKNMPFREVAVLHPLHEPLSDYRTEVNMDGKSYEGRFSCKGIDALAIGPAIGNASDEARYLYVACISDNDTLRADSEYNRLLCYRLDDFSHSVHQYFIRTGLTSYGIQNMEWDSFRQCLHLFVYPGQKSSNPNYSQFSIDVTQPSYYAPLQGVSYFTEPVEQLKVASASHFAAGAQGICQFDESRFLTAEYKKIDNHRYTTIKLFPKRKNVKKAF